MRLVCVKSSGRPGGFAGPFPLAALLALAVPGAAFGYGAEGHRVAGRIAETYLCERAALRIARLSKGGSLPELGSWADRIRSQERWAHTAPWHYLNIEDRVPWEHYRAPEEGDVLWAIEHFGARLADASLTDPVRLEALRFLTHFIVDVHQPLHVGRAADRGGNRVSIATADGSEMNLHRFWDSETLRLTGLTEEAYIQRVLLFARPRAHEWTAQAPRDWARESRSLRVRVYDFEPGERLRQSYLDAAEGITRLRLAQAGVRLAEAMNRALCEPDER